MIPAKFDYVAPASVEEALSALSEHGDDAKIMWRRAVVGVPADELAEAVGLLTTILGAGKDALARRYVSLASQRHVPTLDLSALFAGIEG